MDDFLNPKDSPTESQPTTHRVPLSLCPERLGLLSTLALSVISLGGLLVLLAGVAAMVIHTREIEARTSPTAIHTENRKLEQELASLNQRLTGLWDVLLEARTLVLGSEGQNGVSGFTWVATAETPATSNGSLDDRLEFSGTQLDETLRQAREVSECFEEMLTRMERNASVWAGIPSIQPVRGVEPTSRFGLRTDPFTGRLGWHEGLDFGAPVGTPVRAPAAGLVVCAGWFGNYGQLVEIDHGNGLVTRYGHLSRLLVKLGERIEREDLVGLVGTTGRSNAPHLHYEVHLYGQPVNPEPFILGDFAVASAGPVGSLVASAGFSGPIVPAVPRPD